MLHQILNSMIMQKWLAAPIIMLGGLIVLVIIGIIIIFIAGVFIFFLPAVIVAGVVWWLTGSEFMTGVAFLLIAVLSLSKRK